MVEMMFAYVDGLPIPLFSSSLTSAASENLAGGFVNFFSFLRSTRFKVSPSASGGKIASSSLRGGMTLVNPSNTTSLPLATNSYPSRFTFAEVDKYSASGI